MPRTTTRTATTVVTSFLVVGSAALAMSVAGGASSEDVRLAASAQVVISTSSSTAPSRSATGAPYDFIDLPAHAVSADDKAHEFTVRYRNITDAAREVTSQILIESPEQGPFLSPSEVRLEKLGPSTHRWEPVRLGSQTGTLYTEIPRTGQTLGAGSDLSVQYRITLTQSGITAADHAQLHPRIVVYRPAAAGATA